MAVVTFPLLTVTDDSGTVLTGATVSITSVKDKAGNAIASHGATLNTSDANISVDYDAEVKGEAWIVLSVSKAGSTITGLNAAPAFFLSKDSSRINSGISSTGTVTVGTNNDKTGYSLSQSFPNNFAALAITGSGAVTVGTNNDKTGYTLTTTPPTAAAIATQVWSESLPGSYSSGQAGFKLNAAGSAADPWSTTLPGSYASGSAGNIIGNRLDVAVGSRMATFTLPANFASLSITGGGAVTVGTNNDKTGYSLASLPALPTDWITAASISTAAATKVATEVWATTTRTLSSGANIVLVKGTGITGFNDLDASGIRAAVGLASANLDTQFSGIPAGVWGYGTRTLTSGGSLTAADVWTYTTRTLTAQSDSPGVTILLTRVPGTITVNSGKVSATLNSTDVTGNIPVNVTSLSNGVITDAAFTVPAEASGRPTEFMAMVRRIFEKMSNKKTRDRSTGQVLLRNAADTATLETQVQATVGTLDSITKGT